MKIVAFALVFTIGAITCSYAQDGRSYGVLQGGVTSSNKAAGGIEVGQNLGRNLQVYVAGGWLQNVQGWSASHVSSGVKLMLPTVRARPYVLGGLGAIQFRNKPLDSVNQFLAEAGAGVAFAVGRQGYIDLGYRYMQPYEVAKNLSTGRMYAAFGFRY